MFNEAFFIVFGSHFTKNKYNYNEGIFKIPDHWFVRGFDLFEVFMFDVRTYILQFSCFIFIQFWLKLVVLIFLYIIKKNVKNDWDFNRKRSLLCHCEFMTDILIVFNVYWHYCHRNLSFRETIWKKNENWHHFQIGCLHWIDIISWKLFLFSRQK